MGGGAPGPSATRPGVFEVALVLDELEIHAAETARKGVMAVEGLAARQRGGVSIGIKVAEEREPGTAWVWAGWAYRAAPLRRRISSSTASGRWVARRGWTTARDGGGVERCRGGWRVLQRCSVDVVDVEMEGGSLACAWPVLPKRKARNLIWPRAPPRIARPPARPTTSLMTTPARAMRSPPATAGRCDQR